MKLAHFPSHGFRYGSPCPRFVWVVALTVTMNPDSRTTGKS